MTAPLRDARRERRSPAALGAWARPLLDEMHRDGSAGVLRYHGAKSLRELSLREVIDTSIPQQLHSEDRNSMMHSVESRLPFLDYRLVEYALALPDEFKLRDGATKAIAREGLRDVLPETIRERHDKVGFPAPEEAWVRRNRQRVRSELAEVVERFDDFLTPALLDHFDAALGRDTPLDGLFFRAVTLNRWAHAFGDASGPVVRDVPAYVQSRTSSEPRS